MKKLIVLVAAACIGTAVFAAGTKETESGPVRVEFMLQFDLTGDEWTAAERAEEELSIDIEYTVVSNEQLENVTMTRMAGGDLPDLFQIQYAQPYKDALRGQLLANISSIAERLSLANIQEEINSVESLFGDIFREADGYYRIPTLTAPAFGWHYVFRKDWADQAGLEYDGSLESFRNLLEGMVAYAGPDVSGLTAAGTVWVVTVAVAAFAGDTAPAWSVPNLRESTNGEWYAVEATDAYRDALRWVNGLHEDGLLDPDLVSNNRESAIQKFVTGRSAAFISNGVWADSVYNSFMKANPDAEMDALPTAPLGPAGYARPGSPGYYKSWVIGTNSETRSDAAARLLDLLLSDEYLEIMTRPEGFTNTGGGQAQHTWARLFGAYSDLEMWHWTAQKGLSNATAEVVIQDPRALEYATGISAQFKPEVASVINDYMPRFVFGALDIDDDEVWHSYLDELEDAGLPRLLDDIAQNQ